MLAQRRHVAIAAELARAARLRRPVAPLTERIPGFGVADAYAVQGVGVARRQAAGARRVGWKVGLTSASMQRQLGVEEPDFGPLLDDMELVDGHLALEELIAPRVEGELAFVLGRDLDGPGVDETAALRAVAAVLPALEIVDSRIVDWRVTLADTVADHASCARFVRGQPLPLPDDLDLAELGLTVSVDGTPVATGSGRAVLGHPARALAWLANALAGHGERLRAGDVVLAGALHAAVAVTAASVVEAWSPPLGRVGVRFHGALPAGLR